MAIDTDTNKAVATRLVQDVFNSGNMRSCGARDPESDGHSAFRIPLVKEPLSLQ